MIDVINLLVLFYNTVDICTNIHRITIIYPVIMNGNMWNYFNAFTVIKPHDGNTGCGGFIVIGIAGTGEKWLHVNSIIRIILK